MDEEIKLTGQIGGRLNDEDLEIRFKTFLKQMKLSRGLHNFTDQIRALMDEVEKSQLASEMSYGAQLTELNQLQARISEVFVNIARQNETDKIHTQRLHEEEINKMSELINKLKDREVSLKEDLEEKNTSFKELTEKHQKLSEDIPGLKGRIDDQGKVIESLEEQLLLKNETISNQAQKIDSMTRDISQNEELKLTLSNIQEEVITLQEQHEKAIQQREFDFKNELFNKERELQEVFQTRIEKIQDQMNDKYEERLASILEKHDNRVNALLAELTDLKVRSQQCEQTEINSRNTIKELQEQNKKLAEENTILQNSITRNDE